MKIKNIILSGVLGLFVASAMVSCGGKSSSLQSQLDSLSAADSLHQEDIRQMTDFVNTMSIGLDSISAQEGLVRQMGNKEGNLDKAALSQQLQSLAKLLRNQRERITELEAQVANNNSAYGKRIKKLIAYYKAELDQKDEQIAKLQEELKKKDTNIAELTENVNNLTTNNTLLTDTVKQQKKTVASQKQTIAEQDETIHTGFVAVGSSKQLKSKGLIKGGFLSKKRFDASNADASKFQKVDIRNYNNIRLNSSHPRILTQMPSGSYEIVKGSNGTSTLHIKDVKTFWSVSKFLVIKL